MLCVWHQHQEVVDDNDDDGAWDQVDERKLVTAEMEGEGMSLRMLLLSAVGMLHNVPRTCCLRWWVVGFGWPTVERGRGKWTTTISGLCKMHAMRPLF